MPLATRIKKDQYGIENFELKFGGREYQLHRDLGKIITRIENLLCGGKQIWLYQRNGAQIKEVIMSCI